MENNETAEAVRVEVTPMGIERPGARQGTKLQLAGMGLAELRQSLYDELFQVCLPFWDKHGIDHENGGVMCGLDYDGTRVNTEKMLWFQGRAIWVYSFLYNHFGKNPQFLEVARKTKEFVFTHAFKKTGGGRNSCRGKGKSCGPSVATRKACTSSSKACRSTPGQRR